ncbi:MAG: protein translocase subunit SecD, partial [Betaproteobacteria bacterium]|nr:protein translocase subunit SecD [Betaproteobacteria bacterium]
MNRYALWKYLVILIAFCIGGLYTLPNFFGEAPAVQVSAARASVKVDTATLGKVEESLKAANLTPTMMGLENNSLKARFETTEQQLQAKDAMQHALNPDAATPSYVVALNLIPRTPSWLSAMRAAPMYLGLDLRGGVHFMLQVDMQAALTKKLDALSGDMRSALREKSLRHNGISREQQNIQMVFRDQATADAAQSLMRDQFPDLLLTTSTQGDEVKLSASLKPEAARKVQEQALKQNITTLHNRINELGVAEPVIQQQGLDRIVVQLPGVQDTAKAKDILGRTATLEIRLVDDSSEARSAELSTSSIVPFGDERFLERTGQAVVVKKQVLLTGENLTDAQPGFDSQTQEAAVHLTLDAKGARI